MDINLILGYLGALFVGITLGLIGSGGSILSLPIFVYLFGLNPVIASAYSLFTVGSYFPSWVYKKYKTQTY